MQPRSLELDRTARRYAAKPSVSEMSFAIEQPSTGFTWRFGDVEQPFYIAGITKLYTVAIIMQLRHEGILSLDTRVAAVLGDEAMRGLVVHDGHDYGAEIVVCSDTNYDLLGRIIEVSTSNSSDHELSQRVIAPLGLESTWLVTERSLDRHHEPIDYGIGMMRYRTPRWRSPRSPISEMIGHSGSLGTVLHYAPERDLYMSGTVNQMRSRSLPYPLLSRLVAECA